MFRVLAVCALGVALSGCEGSRDGHRSKPETEAYLAFEMGYLYQSACLWNDLEQLDKANNAMKYARLAAEALGVSLPENPDWSGMPTHCEAGSIASSIEARHGEKTASSFALGFLVHHGMYGSILGADTESIAHGIEKAAVVSKIPEQVWRPRLDAIYREPSADNFWALLGDLKNQYVARPR